jgi:hypothetical protein
MRSTASLHTATKPLQPEQSELHLFFPLPTFDRLFDPRSRLFCGDCDGQDARLKVEAEVAFVAAIRQVGEKRHDAIAQTAATGATNGRARATRTQRYVDLSLTGVRVEGQVEIRIRGH